MANMIKDLLSPDQAKLLDDQLRQQSLQQGVTNYGSDPMGKFLTAASGAQRASAGFGMAAERAIAGRQMGANEQGAVQAQKQMQQAEKEAQVNIESVKQQAIAAVSGGDIEPAKSKALLTAISADRTGELSSQIVKKFASEAMDIDIKDPYSHLVVVGNKVFDKKDKKYIEPSVDSKGNTQKLEDVAETYGIDVKDLSGKDRARLGTIASSMSSKGSSPVDIQAALNGEIVAIFDKNEEEDSNRKDAALNAQLNSLDSLISSAKQAKEMSPDSFAEASINAIAGFLGVPWTEGLSVGNYVTQIKSNLAFDRLQAMRDASKTGGALGQVSNIELKLLEANLTSLDPKDANFKQQLETVIKHYEAFSAALRGRVPDGYKEVKGKIYQQDSQGDWYEV